MLPLSRSFWIWELRFGSTGTGGGGWPSLWTLIRERWRVFRAVSSVWRSVVVWVVVRDFDFRS